MCEDAQLRTNRTNFSLLLLQTTILMQQNWPPKVKMYCQLHIRRPVSLDRRYRCNKIERSFKETGCGQDVSEVVCGT